LQFLHSVEMNTTSGKGIRRPHLVTAGLRFALSRSFCLCATLCLCGVCLCYICACFYALFIYLVLNDGENIWAPVCRCMCVCDVCVLSPSVCL
jgi:hypothetical protein